MFGSDVLSGDVFDSEVFGKSIFGGRVRSEVENAPRPIAAAPAGVPSRSTAIQGFGRVPAPGASRAWMRPLSFRGSPDGLGAFGNEPVDMTGMMTFVNVMQQCFGPNVSKCDCPPGSAGATAILNAIKTLPPEQVEMIRQKIATEGFPPGTPECAKAQIQALFGAPGGQEPGGQQPAPAPAPAPTSTPLTQQPWFLPAVIGGGVLVAIAVASQKKRSARAA